MSKKDRFPTEDSPTYDPETGTYRAYHDWERDGTPSWSVVETVAAATGADPRSMRPLYEVVDPDALDRVVGQKSGSDRWSLDGCVTFRFEGCEVAVDTDGRTVVSPPDADRP